MRILFALPGLHRVDRGAEVAFIAIASILAAEGDDVTLIGSGRERLDAPYRFLRAPAARREWFERMPSLPALRNETSWEEASFIPGFLRRYRPSDYDVVVTCTYPFINWALGMTSKRNRPAHVFVTQNGDWPAISDKSEFRFFHCDGLVCTNPDFYEATHQRWPAALIPNGVAVDRFCPGRSDRARFGLPAEGRIVLMVSALIASKNVADGIRAVATLPDVHLVCAGDGPLRDEIAQLGHDLLPDRFTRISVAPADMPALYRSADVFMHLSKNEPFGNVFVEAMASGLPIVAYRSPRTQWITGENVFFPDDEESASLGRAIEAAGKADLRLPTENAERAQDFAWSRIAARYRDFFEQLLVKQRGKTDG